MAGRDFLDTNVIVYAYDDSDPSKQRVAQELVRKALAGDFAISTQVLTEFAATLIHKLTPPPAAQEIVAMLDALAPIPLIIPDGEIVRRAVEARAVYGIHFYDGMIIAAAERAHSAKIISEDLKPGQKYFGVSVVNPF